MPCGPPREIGKSAISDPDFVSRKALFEYFLEKFTNFRWRIFALVSSKIGPGWSEMGFAISAPRAWQGPELGGDRFFVIGFRVFSGARREETSFCTPPQRGQRWPKNAIFLLNLGQNFKKSRARCSRAPSPPTAVDPIKISRRARNYNISRPEKRVFFPTF